MNSTPKVSGYGEGEVSTLVSAEEVNTAVNFLNLKAPTMEDCLRLVEGKPCVYLENLNVSYGKFEILHHFSLAVGKAQSVCLIGPNGAGKSTVLHAIYGFADILGGKVEVNGVEISSLSPSEKLKCAGIAYILQNNSIFPDMSVEENLMMGGYTLESNKAKEQTEWVLQKYDRLRSRAKQAAKSLSGGERRLLEISRALITQPEVLLIDEPSIGLEPRYIDMVFEIITDLQKSEGKTIIMVEQNAKKGLHFSDIAYVLVAGKLAMVGSGDDLLHNPDVGRLFLGG